MFCKSLLLYAFLGALYSTAFASPSLIARNTPRTLADAAKHYPQLLPLADGNEEFRYNMEESHPGLLHDLTTNGQHPEYLFLGCSDSRVSEGTIFSALPGDLFTERNIANQYTGEDLNAIATVAYGVTALKVGHIIVMGHYGCGGVQASILNKPDHLDNAGGAVQQWIDPVRSLYKNSTREEIVKLREYRSSYPDAKDPAYEDAGFRALIEENVKNSVYRIAQGAVMTDHWKKFMDEHKSGHKARAPESGAPLKPVYVHGFVYDISTGHIYDLNVSQGPPGYKGDPSKCKRNILAGYRHGEPNPEKVDGC